MAVLAAMRAGMRKNQLGGPAPFDANFTIDTTHYPNNAVLANGWVNRDGTTLATSKTVSGAVQCSVAPVEQPVHDLGENDCDIIVVSSGSGTGQIILFGWDPTTNTGLWYGAGPTAATLFRVVGGSFTTLFTDSVNVGAGSGAATTRVRKVGDVIYMWATGVTGTPHNTDTSVSTYTLTSGQRTTGTYGGINPAAVIGAGADRQISRFHNLAGTY